MPPLNFLVCSDRYSTYTLACDNEFNYLLIHLLSPILCVLHIIHVVYYKVLHNQQIVKENVKLFFSFRGSTVLLMR